MANESDSVPSLAEDPALGLSHRAKMEVLFAVMLGLFLGALDQTIVGPALPTIVTQLNGNDYYVWAITIYLLTSTISVPFWGKLSDLYGRKPMYMLGIVIFLVGSALSGLSQNMGMLILFRGIQGIGAGALFPVALAIIGDLFTPQERGKYQGLFGAVFGIAFVVGPLVGGFLTENFGWHWIFYVNIPIGIVALVVIQRLLPTVKTASRHAQLRPPRRRDLHRGDRVPARRPDQQAVRRLDRSDRRWLHPGRHHRHAAVHPGRVARQGADRPARPVAEPDLLGIDGLDVLRGVRLLRRHRLPAALVPGRRGLLADRLRPGGAAAHGRPDRELHRVRPDRLPNRPLQVARSSVSIAVMGVGTLLMTQLTKDTPVPVVWLWMFIVGLGVGPTFSVFTIVIQNAVPFRQLGVATSNLTFFRQIGGTIALAFVGTIFGTTFIEKLAAAADRRRRARSRSSPGSARQRRARPQPADRDRRGFDLGATILATAPAQVRPLLEPFIANIVEGIHGAFSLATAQTFWLGVAGSIIAVVAAVAIKEIPLRASNEEPASAKPRPPARPRSGFDPGRGTAQATVNDPSPTTD